MVYIFFLNFCPLESNCTHHIDRISSCDGIKFVGKDRFRKNLQKYINKY